MRRIGEVLSGPTLQPKFQVYQQDDGQIFIGDPNTQQDDGDLWYPDMPTFLEALEKGMEFWPTR